MDADGCKQNEPLCFKNTENTFVPPMVSGDVVQSFSLFLNNYDKWRTDNNLPGSIENVHEIISSMTDKLGRIARYVKHQERNDPKPDWPDGMASEMSGLLVYMIMLKNYYNIDVIEGMKCEFQKAIKQHSKQIKGA